MAQFPKINCGSCGDWFAPDWSLQSECNECRYFFYVQDEEHADQEMMEMEY